MKISLRWLCDHVAVKWQDIDVNKLVAEFNTKTAEIEKVIHYQLDISSFTVAQVTATNTDSIAVSMPEWNTTALLPARTDGAVDSWYLVKKNGDAYTWATYADIQSEKEGLLKAVACTQEQAQSGVWRDQIETEDYIFEVDNKSITHRPDMWGHRGCAREVAALLNVSMIAEEKLLAPCTVVQKECTYTATALAADSIMNQKFKDPRFMSGWSGEAVELKELPFSLALQTPACTALAALYIHDIAVQPSVLTMALRLARVDSKFHDASVDITNYVMFDLGHPMHAFDAAAIETGKLEVRMAHANEQLQTLDGTDLQLTERDVVISDGERALSLAGIKGGKDSGISAETHSVLLEAACFDAGTIRLSSAHHKLRTDASARFEKSLDQQQAPKTIMRYLHLLREYGIAYSGASAVVVLGSKQKAISITVTHAFIEERLGVELTQDFVTATLTKLEFKVTATKADQGIEYHITVPSFRATKDVAIKEDIVEEIGRFFGYTRIPSQLPGHIRQVGGLTWFDKVLRIKEFLAQQACMHEVQNYAFFDNDFTVQLQWPVVDNVSLVNPLSEQRTTLVTSLIPHLLQNISQNMANNDTLAFFEWARTWQKTQQSVMEKQVLAGVWYERKGDVDFYACKEHLIGFFEMLDLPVVWEKLETNSKKTVVWASTHQIAQLMYDGRVIGSAGKVSKALMHALGGGDAFIFELDADFIKEYTPALHRFVPIAKYQATSLDVSVMVPLAVTVADLTTLIAHADTRIFDVVLQDTFQKDEWKDSKSITMRFFVRDQHKTLEKHEIDAVYAAVVASLEQHSAQVRS